MQSLDIEATYNPNGHSPAEVLAAIQGRSGSRRLDFRYELIDGVQGGFIRDLDNVLSCTVEQNWLADIKRTATFRLRDVGYIDYLTNYIRPYVRLYLPPYGDRDWVDLPQGTFILSSPVRTSDETGTVTREVRGYDLLQVIADRRVTTRFAVVPGDHIMTVVRDLINATGIVSGVVVPYSTALEAAGREWPPGTSYLRIVNDLLGSLNYESLSIDESGVPRVSPYRLPSERSEEYVYADDQNGLMIPGHEQSLDLWSVPNQWTIAVSNPDQPPLVATYTNNNPGSPTSTVRRGRVIAAEAEFVDAVDLSTLSQIAARRGFEASQIYESVEFSTALVPMHSGNDCYRIQYAPLAINAKYIEHSWSMSLQAGASMRHRARRVVSV